MSVDVAAGRSVKVSNLYSDIDWLQKDFPEEGHAEVIDLGVGGLQCLSAITISTGLVWNEVLISGRIGADEGAC